MVDRLLDGHELFERGWRRHSVIASAGNSLDSLSAHLSKSHGEICQLDGAIALVTTYDCAVIHHSFDLEPWVQLLLAFRVEPSKQFFSGRDARRLHFSVIRNGNTEYFETNASCLCQVGRSLLLELEPDSTYLIPDTEKHDLRNWLAERFRQDTWPNAFNQAVKPAEKRLKRLWVRYNKFLSGLYISLDTYDELEGRKYKVSILFLVEGGRKRELISTLRGNHKDLVEGTIDEVLQRVESDVLNAFGDTVEIIEDVTKPIGLAIEVIEEDEMTVRQLRDFSRFSPYSLSELDEDPLPAEMLGGRASGQ
ncbi:MAG: hypothetical protein ABJL54_19735 [Halioglobus sp.]